MSELKYLKEQEKLILYLYAKLNLFITQNLMAQN